MSNKVEKKQWTFTGWHMLIITVSFFAVVFGMNFFMAMSALNSWTGLVVKNTYVASQEYNGKQATTRTQHDLGWNSSIEHENGNLIFSLRDKDNNPISAEQVSLKVHRVVGVDGELNLTLTRQPNGEYSAPAPLASGVWNVTILASLSDGTMFEHYYQIKLEK